MKIFLIGFMGTGKTYWGKRLSERLHIPFFDLDEQIVTREMKTINQIFTDRGEEYFRFLEKNVLQTIGNLQKNFVLSCGGGTACFNNNLDYMNMQGVTVWLNTSTDVLYTRLLKEKNLRPLLKDLNDDQLKDYIIKKLSDRKIYYEQAHLTLEEDSLTLEN